jgi:hypothetical protein
MVDVETAVAFARAATSKNDDLMKAQSRLWASQVTMGVPVRVLAALSAAGGVAPDDMARLQREGDLDGAVALQAGRLADMNFVAERITGYKVAE